MLGMGLVERSPDPVVIIVVHAAAEGDLGPGRDQHHVFGVPAGRQEISAVDHRRGQVGVVDLGPGARPPCRTGLGFEEIGCIVAHELEGITAFEKRDALNDMALKLDAFHLRAVLLALAGPLSVLVALKFALDTLARAVEEIDRRPEKVFEIRLQPRVAEHFEHRGKHRGQRRLDHWLLR